MPPLFSIAGHIVSPLSIRFVLKMVIRETFLPLNGVSTGLKST